MQMSRRRAILVLGMHRSGTSALTRVINLMGARTPENLIGPSHNNPSGYWEGRDFVAMHDEILHAAGTRWDDWARIEPEWFESRAALELQSKLAQLISAQFGNAQMIVAKDPRMCRLVPMWLGALAQLDIEPLVVLGYRNPLEVAASLKERNGFIYAKSSLIWLRHALEAEEVSRSLPRSIVQYDQLLNDWRPVVAGMESDLSISWPTSIDPELENEIDTYLNEAHRHHASDRRALEEHPRIIEWVSDAYRAYLDLTEGRGGQAPLKTLDRVREEFDQASAVFRLVLPWEARELDDVRQQAKTFKSNAAALDRDLQEAERRLAEAEQQVSDADARLAQAEERARGLDDERERLKGELRQAHAVSGNAAEVSKAYQSALSAFEARISDRAAQIEQERAAFSVGLESARAEARRLDDEVADLRARLKETADNAAAAETRARAALEEAERERAALSAQYERLCQESDETRQRLEGDLARASEAEALALAELEAAQQDRATLEERLERAREESGGLEQDVAELTAQLVEALEAAAQTEAQAKADLEAAQLARAELEREIEELREQLRQALERAAEIEAEAEAERVALEGKLERAREDAEGLEQDISDLKAVLAEETDRSARAREETKAELESAEARRASLEKEIARLQENLQNEIERASEARAETKAELADVRSQRKAYREERDAAFSEREEMAGALKTSREETQALTERIERLETRLRKEIAKTEEAESRAKSDLQQATEDRARLESRLIAAGKEISEFEAQAGKLHERLREQVNKAVEAEDKAQEELRKAAKKRREMADQLEEARQKSDTLEMQVADLEERLQKEASAASAREEAARAELESSQRDRTALEAKLTAALAEADVLEQNLAELQANLRTQIERADAAETRAQTALESAHAERAALEDRLADVQSDAAGLGLDVAELRTSLQQQIERAMEAEAAAREARDAAQQDRAALEAKISDASEAAASRELELAPLQEQLRRQIEEAEAAGLQAQDELEAIRRERSELETSLAEARRSNADLESQVAELRARIEHDLAETVAKAELEQARKERAELEESLGAVRLEAESYEAQVLGLQDQLQQEIERAAAAELQAQSELETALRERERLEVRYTAAVTDAQTAERRARASQGQVNALSSQLISVAAENEQTKLQLSEEIEQTRLQLEDSERRAIELKSKLNEKSDQALNAKKLHEQAEQRLEILAGQAGTLELQGQALMHRAAQLEGMLASSLDHGEELRQGLQAEIVRRRDTENALRRESALRREETARRVALETLLESGKAFSAREATRVLARRAGLPVATKGVDHRDLDTMAALVAESALFDRAFYFRQNPGLEESGADPVRHYLETGWAEGRRAGPLFDDIWYLDRDPRLAAAGVAPLAHYLNGGFSEGRSPHPLFDANYYRAQAGIGKDIEPVSHYLSMGWKEKYDPHPLFDTKFYLSEVGDEAAQKTPPLLHFLSPDSASKADPHPLFDTQWYQGQRNVHSGGADDALTHYLSSRAGWDLNPHALFDGSHYLQRYSDVAKAGLNPLVHYVLVGENEGRDPHPLIDTLYRLELSGPKKKGFRLRTIARRTTGAPVIPCKEFDPVEYAELNTGVSRAGSGPLLHFLQYGWREDVQIGKGQAVNEIVASLAKEPETSPHKDTRVGRFLFAKYGLGDEERRKLYAKQSMALGEKMRHVDIDIPVDKAAAAAMSLRTIGPVVDAAPHPLARLPTLQMQDTPCRVVIYSCLFGDYESVKEPTQPAGQGVRYILFTDRDDLESEHWEIVRVAEGFDDLRRTSRLPKILPHAYLPPHEISIYLDASLRWENADPIALAERLLGGNDIALYPHYARECVYDEIAHCIEKEIIDREAGEKLVARYEEMGFPKKAGLFENAFIIRRNTEQMRLADILWWAGFLSGPHRDQFYLLPALNRLGMSVSPIKEGPQFRESTFMTHVKHAYKKAPGQMKVCWVMKREAAKGWAYANNTKRFINALPFDEHQINEPDKTCTIALFFDALIHQGTSKRGQHNMLRLGGPRPLRRLFRGDIAARAAYLHEFDALIALSPDLARLGDMAGVPTYLVPNGIDTSEWVYNYDPNMEEFVVGFAANVANEEEARLKGYDLVQSAARRAKVTLRTVEKGEDSQLPHDAMREEFYGKISCLIHPVAEGKEGSSNVIMEALACGVPVITTPHCGFHASQLKHEENVLFGERDSDELTALVKMLRDDKGLRDRLSRNGRRFVERVHDIRKIAREYRNIFSATRAKENRVRVAFVPFRTPVETLATGRLRCAFMSEALNEYYGRHVRADIGLIGNADIIVVSQLCNEKTLLEVQARAAEGARIIYDVCDPYYDRNQEVFGVHAAQRFWELVDLADTVSVPTQLLADLLRQEGVAKPIVVTPDMIDYRDQMNSELAPPTKKAVWFGNPGHGNFTSGEWALRRLKDKWKHDILVISRLKHLKAPDDFTAVEWEYEGFVERIREAGVAVVSHDPEQKQKSNNRLMAAIANGVPVISTGSHSGAQLLAEVGFPEMSVANDKELDAAMERLADPAYRREYVERAQAIISDQYGALPVARNYFNKVLGASDAAEPAEVADKLAAQ